MAAARGGGVTSAPVTMIAGTVAGSRASSALPSIPGIRMSASTRSTGSWASRASASRPSPASSTRPASPASSPLSTPRDAASSSASRTVPTAGVRSGRPSTTVVPASGALVSVRSPPRIRASRRAYGRPSPVPPRRTPGTW